MGLATSMTHLGRRDLLRLRKIDSALKKAHGTAPLGNKPDPLDEWMFIQLTVRTRNRFSSGVYDRLWKEVRGDWGNLLETPRRRIKSLLRPAGMSAVKTDRFRNAMQIILDRFGRVTLAPLKRMDDAEAERFLRTIPGTGPKVARCVLMYSLGRKVFPVDTNCRRVLRRLGFLPGYIPDKASHDYLQARVPPSIRYTLHVNLVHHGQRFCRPGDPLCEQCPIRLFCPTGRKVLSRRFPRMVRTDARRTASPSAQSACTWFSGHG